MNLEDAISSPSLHKEVLQQLREFIVRGGLSEGRVPERVLCEKFGVSRTPLREALKVLAAEGIIELLPNRGARLRTIETAELKNLFDVMGGLEALAGRLACENITPSEIDEIEKRHQEMYLFYLRRDIDGYFAKNKEIHWAIVSAARNPKLSELYQSVTTQIDHARYSVNLSVQYDRWGDAMREHEQILDALRRKSGIELGEILFQHLVSKWKATQDPPEQLSATK